MPRAWIERWLKSLGQKLARRGYATIADHKGAPKLVALEVTVVFVPPKEIRRLNREFRAKDKVTDILSFAAEDPESIGELVLCPDVIRRQGQSTGLGTRGELGYMLVHGVLHLLGHDHEIASERRRMFALQDQLYSALEKSVGLR